MKTLNNCRETVRVKFIEILNYITHRYNFGLVFHHICIPRLRILCMFDYLFDGDVYARNNNLTKIYVGFQKLPWVSGLRLFAQ